MDNKSELITALREIFNRWQELLRDMSADEIIASPLDGGMSVKDILAHLTAWQKRSVARVEAALNHGEPAYLQLPPGLDMESEDDLDRVNAWIDDMYRDLPWSDIHQEWQDRFLRFLELAEAVPEQDLFEVGKYEWLKEYPLSAVLLGSFEHHEEHLQPLLGLR